MSNTLLTPTAVTREALRVLHEKLSFLGTINRQYDDSFARTGAKIGDSLKIRLPNEYTVRTGKTLQAQDTTETSTTLTVATQKGVDMNFSSAELTLDLDDFSNRILEPAMAVLASNIEEAMLSDFTLATYNQVGTAGTVPTTTLVWGQARAKLNQSLAPKDNNRCIQCDSLVSAQMVDEWKGLFHDSTQISRQYLEGKIGRAIGFDWFENERTKTITMGDDQAGAIDDSGLTNMTEGTTTMHIDALGTTLTKGTVFTIAGVLAVHAETKQSYSHEQQFVVTATPTIGSNEADVTFAPAMYSTGARQNISAMPSDNDVVTFVGTASTAYAHSMTYHKDAFTFATADLELPQGVHFAARQVYDGISMRIVRDYDVNNDNFPCRIDILHGGKTIRPQLACRVTS